MGTSIKLHNKTLDKTTTLLSPDNQTTDLELKIPNKSGTIATTEDLGSAVNEEKVTEIINKTLTTESTIEKLKENLTEVKKENEDTEVNGVYIQSTTSPAKNSFVKPLDRTICFSVGDGEKIKGADEHFITLKEALAAATYYQPVNVAGVKTYYKHTNKTNANENYNGVTPPEVIAPGKTKEMELNWYGNTISNFTIDTATQNILSGDIEIWKDDLNILKRAVNVIGIYIIVKAGYKDKDFHIITNSTNLGFCFILSQDKNIRLDNKAIADKWQLIYSNRNPNWFTVSDCSFGPNFYNIKFSPLESKNKITIMPQGSYTNDEAYYDDANLRVLNGTNKGQNGVDIINSYFHVYGTSHLRCYYCTLEDAWQACISRGNGAISLNGCILNNCVCGIDCRWEGIAYSNGGTTYNNYGVGITTGWGGWCSIVDTVFNPATDKMNQLSDGYLDRGAHAKCPVSIAVHMMAMTTVHADRVTFNAPAAIPTGRKSWRDTIMTGSILTSVYQFQNIRGIWLNLNYNNGASATLNPAIAERAGSRNSDGTITYSSTGQYIGFGAGQQNNYYCRLAALNENNGSWFCFSTIKA